jgi:hypothetical protein
VLTVHGKLGRVTPPTLTLMIETTVGKGQRRMARA